MSSTHLRAVVGAFLVAAVVAVIVVIGATTTEGDAESSDAVTAMSGTTSSTAVAVDPAAAKAEAERVEAFAQAFRAHEAEQARQLEALAAAEQAAALAALAQAEREAQAGIPDAFWDRMAQCETAGNWSMVGSRYSGGLGFYNGTWDSFGGREFAPRAGQATREQQIVVANRVANEVGLSGWGCLGHVGRP
jgi:hypothetical protein